MGYIDYYKKFCEYSNLIKEETGHGYFYNCVDYATALYK